jgi:hypothetical protein
MKSLTVVLLLLGLPATATAQDYDGYVSTMFLAMPQVTTTRRDEAVFESRTRLFAEATLNPGDRVHLRAGLFADALVANREALGATSTVTSAIVRPADLYAEFRGGSFDVRAGMSRIVWGRLDEFQPTDVVNPIDLSRFLLEGRSEARLPVALVRTRMFLPAGSTLEAIVVPFFRAARFDQLDEETSPFRLAPIGIRERHNPATAWRNVQGGARFTSTFRRLDWGISTWRGIEGFPFGEVFPRYTMIGGDFETVRGPWGVRGEVAWFHDSPSRSFEGGVGADRRAGNYRVAINTLVSHIDDDTDVTLVGWAERTFVRETRSARLLAVYDPTDDTAFVRAIGAISVRDNVWLEGSVGWLNGDPNRAPPRGANVLGLLSDRDFLYARLKVHF